MNVNTGYTPAKESLDSLLTLLEIFENFEK